MGLFDFFNPQPQVAPAPAPAQATNPQTHDQLTQDWHSFLTQPDTRAALMQFGLSMLQPIAPGQTFAGHFGQSVGDAGETVNNREQQRQAQALQQFNNELALSKLGIENQDLSLRREDNAATHDEAKARLGLGKDELGLRTKETDAQIAARNAGIEIDRANANTARIGSQWRGQLTGNKVMDARLKLENLWTNQIMSDEERTPEAHDAFIAAGLKSLGIDPNAQDAPPPPVNLPFPDNAPLVLSPGAARQQSGAGSLDNAGPPGPANVAPVPPISAPISPVAPAPAVVPPSNPSGQLSSNQFMLQFGATPKMQQLVVDLHSSDPNIKSQAAAKVQLIKSRLTDPENFHLGSDIQNLAPAPVVPAPVAPAPVAPPLVLRRPVGRGGR